MLSLLESLLPPDVWANIQKASQDIPKIVESIQGTMISVDARLTAIQKICDHIDELVDCCYVRIIRLEMLIDPSAVTQETTLTLLDQRVQNGVITGEDASLLKDIPVNQEDLSYRIITPRKPN
jgi:hypothetical protein